VCVWTGPTSQHCCVPLCANSSKYNSSISFHSFPVDVSVRAEWMVRVRREDFTPSKMSHVCSRHFQKGDFVNNPGKLRKLKKGAIPTLFSWNDFQIPAPRASVKLMSRTILTVMDRKSCTKL
uniref:THAP domain-containing protein 1 n=1 Tax=Oryzias sinensis TaxID=183150 RepID=A0A8C7WRT9_9TELE